MMERIRTRIRTRLLFAFLAIVFFLPAFLVSSAPEKKLSQYVLDAWGLEDGLPQNSIFCILQARDGYLWMGTQGGLVRFDGVRFKTFDKHNVPQMAGSWVQALYEDNRGRLWIGYYDGGLLCLEAGRFKAVPALAGIPVSDVLREADGNILVGTADRGVIRLNPGSGDAVSLTTIANEEKSLRRHVWSLCHGEKGCLWISTSDGLCRLEDGRLTVYTTREGLPNNILTGMYMAPGGRLWIATGAGLSCFHKGKFTNYSTGNGADADNLRCIAAGPRGDLWIGGRGAGINRFDPETGEFEPLTTWGGKPVDPISSICFDAEGSIWLGTSARGLNRLKSGKLTSFTKQEGLSHNMVKSVCAGPDRDILVGSFGGGVDRLNTRSGRVTPYPPGGGLPGRLINCIYHDSKGNTWIGTAGIGLTRVKNGKVRTFTTEQGMSNSYVSAIIEDRHGVLWFGTYFSGLYRMEPEPLSITSYTTREGLGGNNIWDLHEDREGSIWVAAYGGGITHKKGDTFTVYTTKDGLSTNYVKSIYEDREGALWICTGNGFNRFKNGTFTVFTTGHGLYDANPHNVLEDDLGNFWFGGDKGIFRAVKKELDRVADGKQSTVECVVYNEGDGMKSRECNGGNAPGPYKSPGGKLWFPTIEGVVMIEPGGLSRNPLPPPVIIEELQADDTHITAGGFTGAGPLEFPPGLRRIEIKYTGLSLLAPERVRFKYKLEGYDDHWVDVGSRRTAYYTGLPPGDYTFRVKACNNDGVWNLEGASFSFSRAPHVYQTWWFYILAALTFMLLMTGLFRLRVRRIKARAKVLRKLVTRRTRQLQESNTQLKQQREVADRANQSKSDFLARMSHDIRTPMNGVVGFTEMLMETELNGEQAEFTGTIKRSAEALVNLVNDILDFSKIEAGELSLSSGDFDPELIAFDACEIVLPRLENKPVEIMCRIGDNVPDYVVADGGRFRQVLINLVGNAAKFTQQGEIILSMTVEKEEKDRVKLHTGIKDTGPGIPADKLEEIFNPFHQDGTHVGTGLGLPICRQIASLMQGDVWVRSTVGEGSEFHFTAWVEKSRQRREETYGRMLGGKKILLAVSSPVCREILVHGLERSGVRVTAPAEASEVLPVLKEQAGRGEPFDVCILEACEPGDCGVKTVREIRGSGSGPPLSTLTILGLSSASVCRAPWLKEAGFDGFLSRPVSRAKLLKALELVLNEQHRHVVEAKPGKPGPTPGGDVHLLLAEDNPINRKLAHKLLTRAGYRLTVVENGSDAVDAFKADPGAFDAVLMDIQMPLLDGLEATKEIRALGSTIPVIAMTADSMSGDRDKCIAAGMDDYISKPIRRETVLEVIRKWVHRAGQGEEEKK